MSMNLKKAITLAMDGKAVLFLGSGFSFGSKNCQNRTPWTGKALADYIADLCGFPGEPMPLEMAAQEYIRQKGDDELIKLLHEEYDLSSVSSSHCSIMSLPCNGVQREHNKKLNNGLPILHKVPPKQDYGRYFCIMAEKGGTSHGGLTEKLSLFFHAKKQEVNAYGR